MQTILLAFIVAECLILLILALFKKLTRKTFIIISTVTALCCTTAMFLGGSSRRNTNKVTTTKGYIYMATCLLESGNSYNALNALGQVTDEAGAAYGITGLRALAYNHLGAYPSGTYLLQDAAEPDLQELYDCCSRNEICSEDLTERLIQASRDRLALSEAEIQRYEAEMRVRYMQISGESSEDSSAVAQIQAAILHEGKDVAYRLALDNAETGTTADDILVSEMYIQNFNQRLLAQQDEGFDRLLQEVTQEQIQLNRVALEEGMGESYQEVYYRYQLALSELNNETIRRAMNYLEYAQYEESYSIAYHLQMAKLWMRLGQRQQAAACLDTIFAVKDIDPSQWLATDVLLLREAYLDGAGSIDNLQFDLIFYQMMESLYQGVFMDPYDVYDFRELMFSYLRDLYSGIYISKPDVSRFPTVTVDISTSGEFELDPNTVLLTDTQTRIETFTVEQKEVSSISICFVLDRSGSMSGDAIIHARSAIRDFALNMDPDTNAALVSFASDARVDCPLMDSAYIVAAQAESLYASGGTNIASGLITAADQLSGSQGKKIIILLSDGVDGNEELLSSALALLNQENIVVYAVGLPGCDEEYLKQIATQTTGSYFPASDSTALTAIYDEIRGLLKNVYTITYQVTDQEAVERSIWIEAADSVQQTRRRYTTDPSEEQYSQINDIQTSNYYKQNGGTLGGS